MDMQKPKMKLSATDGNFKLIERAACILNAHGFKQEARQIHQEAKAGDYDLFTVLKLLNKYMEM
jgi:hypothetical protein